MSQILEQEYDDSFSKEWDEKITTEIAVYDEHMAWLANLKELEPTINLALTPEKIDKLLDADRIMDEEKKDLIETGIIEDLSQVTKDAKSDRKTVMYPPLTDDYTIKQQYEDYKEDYFKSRLYQHAEDICQHIDGLIQLDKYPEHMFGKYNTIRQLIFKERDSEMSDRLLGQLIILGRSAIPLKIKYEEPVTIESTINSTIRTKEQV